jgi:transposase
MQNIRQGKIAMYRVCLTDEQRLELRRRTHAPAVAPRTRDRLEMVRLADQGFTIPHIARILTISEPRVHHWIKQFLDGGFDALPDPPHLGQRSALTLEILQALDEEIARGQQTWTAAQCAEWIAERFGVLRTPAHLRRFLRRSRLSYKRTHRSLKHKQDPAAVQAAQETLAALEKRGAASDGSVPPG